MCMLYLNGADFAHNPFAHPKNYAAKGWLKGRRTRLAFAIHADFKKQVKAGSQRSSRLDKQFLVNLE